MLPPDFAEGVADYYPLFRRSSIGLPDVVEVWQGPIEPLAGTSAIELIVADLAAGGKVDISTGGRLAHAACCDRQHNGIRPLLPVRCRVDDWFLVRVLIRTPPRHPVALALWPEISRKLYPNHPHLGRTHLVWELPAQDTFCAYRPGDGDWAWGAGSLITFLDYVTIWLAKHVIWLRTGGEHHANGVWLGGGASHLPTDLIREMDPNGECHCGSGRRYMDCHLARDRRWAAVA